MRKSLPAVESELRTLEARRSALTLELRSAPFEDAKGDTVSGIRAEMREIDGEIETLEIVEDELKVRLAKAVRDEAEAEVVRSMHQARKARDEMQAAAAKFDKLLEEVAAAVATMRAGSVTVETLNQKAIDAGFPDHAVKWPLFHMDFGPNGERSGDLNRLRELSPTKRFAQMVADREI